MLLELECLDLDKSIPICDTKEKAKNHLVVKLSDGQGKRIKERMKLI